MRKKGRVEMASGVPVSNHDELLAVAADLQVLADLIGKYPAEAQLIMAAVEDGLTLGPMRVAGHVVADSGPGVGGHAGA